MSGRMVLDDLPERLAESSDLHWVVQARASEGKSQIVARAVDAPLLAGEESVQVDVVAAGLRQVARSLDPRSGCLVSSVAQPAHRCLVTRLA